MIKPLLDSILQIINNNFDLFLLIFLALGVTVILAFYLARLRLLVFLGNFPLFLKSVLLRIVILGQIVLFSGLLVVYWINYQMAAELIQLPENVLVSTDWVKADFPIFFIEDNQLHKINPNGSEHKILFKSKYLIKEYIFSPDGKNILIVTDKDINLFNQEQETFEEVDAIGEIIGDAFDDLKGVIRGVRWSKDSQKFCYEINRWSKYSSQNNLYVYDLKEKKRKSLISPGRTISSVYWDDASENLYYIYNEAMDTSEHGYPFEVKVYKIPLAKMKPEMLVTFPANDPSIPLESLGLRGINLFLENDKLAFGRIVKENSLVSSKGPYVGIDKEDHLYYVRNRWFRKRLFKIKRERIDYIEPEYQKNGGALTIQHISWLPGGNYIIMDHKSIGILILNPKTKQIGRLYKSQGRAFGWYLPKEK